MQHSNAHLFRLRSNNNSVTFSENCVRFTWLVGLPRTNEKSSRLMAAVRGYQVVKKYAEGDF